MRKRSLPTAVSNLSGKYSGEFLTFFLFPLLKSVSPSTYLHIFLFLPLSVLLGVICVHGAVVRPWRDHLAASTRRQHPEEKHRWLHRQVRAHTHLQKYVHTYSHTVITSSACFLVWGLLMCVCVFYRHIAELIFYMEELRAHVRKYGPVMQRYYVQYLSGFDAVVLNELVQVWTPKTKTPNINIHNLNT